MQAALFNAFRRGGPLMARYKVTLSISEKTHLMFLRAYEDHSIIDLEQHNIALRDKLNGHMKIKLVSYKYTRDDNGKYLSEIDYLWLL